MGTIRKQHSKEFKAKVAIEALKGHKTLSKLSTEFGVHAVQISQWKKQLQEGSVSLFERGKTGANKQDALIERLYQQIGQLQVEVEWLRKKGLLPSTKSGR